MPGSLKESDFYTVRDEYDPDQSQLSAFGGGTEATTVAVVREPNDTGILDVTDEWKQELGMPRSALEDFWSVREKYRENSAIDNPNDKAFEDCRLEDRYEQYLQRNDDAWASVEEIAERIVDGESITLGCFEDSDQKCHRHLLMDLIEGVVREKRGIIDKGRFTFRYPVKQ